MRKALLLTSVLLLAGCTDGDWAHMVSFDPPGTFNGADGADAPGGTTAASFTRAAAPQPSDAARCARVADERANDADFAGFDDETQQGVRDKTYADCLAWATAHQTAR